MSWVSFALRRLIVPAVLAGYAANLALYWQLETEGGFTDWQSIGMLIVIALIGFIAAIPLVVALRRMRWPIWANALGVMLIGVVLGTIGAALITVYIEAGDIFGYADLGIATGVATALVWMILNFDLLKAVRRGKYFG